MQRLRSTVPHARMEKYDHACRHTDVAGIELYTWARRVALAAFDDIGHVEVAMRSAMASELAQTYGLHWYRDDTLFDDSAIDLVDEALRRTRVENLSAPPDLIHGKVVASLMFGFWVKLLGRGGYRNDASGASKRIYDTYIWKAAVRRAFPNVGDVERQRVETAASHVQALRNRIAHHEHVIWGVPIAGATDAAGDPLRLPLAIAHGKVLDLAGYIDEDLESWIREHSEMQARIAECPIASYELLLEEEASL